MKRRRGMENIENASFYNFFHRAPYPYFRRLPPTLGHRSHHFVLLYRCDSSPFRSEFFIEFLFENFPERLVRNTIIIKKEENRRRVWMEKARPDERVRINAFLEKLAKA